MHVLACELVDLFVGPPAWLVRWSYALDGHRALSLDECLVDTSSPFVPLHFPFSPPQIAKAPCVAHLTLFAPPPRLPRPLGSPSGGCREFASIDLTAVVDAVRLAAC